MAIQTSWFSQEKLAKGGGNGSGVFGIVILLAKNVDLSVWNPLVNWLDNATSLTQITLKLNSLQFLGEEVE